MVKQQITNKKVDNQNINYQKENVLEQKSKRIFKFKNFNKIISKEDVTKSVDLLNELSKKYTINNKNNMTTFHNDQFISLDNSHFHDIYNHFIKNIKSKYNIKEYNTSTLKYTNFLSKIKKNQLLESVDSVLNTNSVEKFNLRKINLNFHNLIHHKKLVKEDKYVKDSNFENIDNTKENNIFRNIVHKNELNVKKIINECISEQLKKTQEQKSKNTTTHYNERVLRMIENNRKTINSTEKTISRKEIQEMIDNSIRPISIRRITELVSERLKRMSSVDNYKLIF